MKLILEEDEIKILLLESLNAQFPGHCFNQIDFDGSYGRLRKIEVYHEESTEEEGS